MKSLILLIALTICQFNPTTNQNPVEEPHLKFGNKYILKINKEIKNTLSIKDLKSKKIKTTIYSDTLITFDPIFHNEAWELNSPKRKKNRERVIMGGEINKNSIPKNITEVKLKDENGMEYKLSAMKIEIVGKRSRGIYLGRVGGGEGSRSESQKLYEFLIEGIEKSDEIILSDLRFKNGGELRKVGDKICFKVI